jgi:hypothetical protein
MQNDNRSNQGSNKSDATYKDSSAKKTSQGSNPERKDSSAPNRDQIRDSEGSRAPGAKRNDDS